MNHEQVEKALEQICSRLGYAFTPSTYHYITPNQQPDEPYKLDIRVGDQQEIAGIRLINSGQLIHATVGSTQTVVSNAKGEVIAFFNDMTKDTLFGD